MNGCSYDVVHLLISKLSIVQSLKLTSTCDNMRTYFVKSILPRIWCTHKHTYILSDYFDSIVRYEIPYEGFVDVIPPFVRYFRYDNKTPLTFQNFNCQPGYYPYMNSYSTLYSGITNDIQKMCSYIKKHSNTIWRFNVDSKSNPRFQIFRHLIIRYIHQCLGMNIGIKNINQTFNITYEQSGYLSYQDEDCLIDDQSDPFYQYKTFADNGSVHAMWRLGNYYLGSSITSCKNIGLNWMILSASKGYDKAQCALGILYHSESLRTESIEYLEQASKQGNMTAKSLLGNYYLEMANYELACPLLKESAQANMALGLYGLGVMLNEGQCVRKDKKNAWNYLTRAYYRGLKCAEYILICMTNQLISALGESKHKQNNPGVYIKREDKPWIRNHSKLHLQLKSRPISYNKMEYLEYDNFEKMRCCKNKNMKIDSIKLTNETIIYGNGILVGQKVVIVQQLRNYCILHKINKVNDHVIRIDIRVGGRENVLHEIQIGEPINLPLYLINHYEVFIGLEFDSVQNIPTDLWDCIIIQADVRTFSAKYCYGDTPIEYPIEILIPYSDYLM